MRGFQAASAKHSAYLPPAKGALVLRRAATIAGSSAPRLTQPIKAVSQQAPSLWLTFTTRWMLSPPLPSPMLW